MQEKVEKTRQMALSNGARVPLASKPKVTEREIFEDREAIMQRLHAAYLTSV